MFDFHDVYPDIKAGGQSVHFGFLKLNWPTDWWLAVGPVAFDHLMVAFWVLVAFWAVM